MTDSFLLFSEEVVEEVEEVEVEVEGDEDDGDSSTDPPSSVSSNICDNVVFSEVSSLNLEKVFGLDGIGVGLRDSIGLALSSDFEINFASKEGVEERFFVSRFAVFSFNFVSGANFLELEEEVEDEEAEIITGVLVALVAEVGETLV